MILLRLAMDWIQLLTAAQTFMVEELSASPRTLTPRWGARAPWPAGDDALLIADFLFLAEYDPDSFAGSSFRRGAETSTRGRVRSPDVSFPATAPI